MVVVNTDVSKMSPDTNGQTLSSKITGGIARTFGAVLGGGAIVDGWTGYAHSTLGLSDGLTAIGGLVITTAVAAWSVYQKYYSHNA